MWFRKKQIHQNYLTRWMLLPRNNWFNIYLHKYTGSDPGRDLHDHPWHSVSFLLQGRLFEEYLDRRGAATARRIARFWPVYRAPAHTHRISLKSPAAWTLFIVGRRVRDWGFHTAAGWVPWQKYECGEGRR